MTERKRRPARKIHMVWAPREIGKKSLCGSFTVWTTDEPDANKPLCLHCHRISLKSQPRNYYQLMSSATVSWHFLNGEEFKPGATL